MAVPDSALRQAAKPGFWEANHRRTSQVAREISALSRHPVLATDSNSAAGELSASLASVRKAESRNSTIAASTTNGFLFMIHVWSKPPVRTLQGTRGSSSPRPEPVEAQQGRDNRKVVRARAIPAPLLHPARKHRNKAKGPAAAGPLVLKILSYTLKDDPQPQVLLTLGFSNLKPAASSVST